MTSQENGSERLSPVERGEANVSKLRNYLNGLRQSGRSVPTNKEGEPNRTAIAKACGFDRGVLHTNRAAIRLLDEFLGKGTNPDGARAEAHASAQETKIGVLEQRVMRLEQKLAVISVERDELRAQLARYKVVEEDVLKRGRRVIP